MYTVAMSILLSVFTTGAVVAETRAPVFQHNMLSVPRVDTADTMGAYQNVQLQRAADGRWDLLTVTEAQRAKVEAVRVEQLNTVPEQVKVTVTGFLPTACYAVDEPFIRRVDTQFTVVINQQVLQTFAPCTQAVAPFSLSFPLNIFGLSKGTYAVDVHGLTGTFALSKDN